MKDDSFYLIRWCPFQAQCTRIKTVRYIYIHVLRLHWRSVITDNHQGSSLRTVITNRSHSSTRIRQHQTVGPPKNLQYRKCWKYSNKYWPRFSGGTVVDTTNLQDTVHAKGKNIGISSAQILLYLTLTFIWSWYLIEYTGNTRSFFKMMFYCRFSMKIWTELWSIFFNISPLGPFGKTWRLCCLLFLYNEILGRTYAFILNFSLSWSLLFCPGSWWYLLQVPKENLGSIFS